MNLFLEFTNTCNAKCIFCENPSLKNKEILSIEYLKNLKSIIDKAKFIDITGYGEVTTHPDFTKILKVLKKPLKMVTNGFNLSKYYNEILNSSISNLIISLNSLDLETHKKLMGINQNKLHGIIQSLRDLKKDRFKGDIELSFVINKLNFDEIKNFIDLGKELNSHIACLGLSPTLQNIYPEEIILENNEVNRNKILEYKEYAKEKGVSLYMFNLDNQSGEIKRDINLPESIKKCYWYKNYIFIGISGNVNICCWNKVPIGNIRCNSIEEIYDGLIFKDLEKSIKNGSLKYCSKCRKDG